MSSLYIPLLVLGVLAMMVFRSYHLRRSLGATFRDVAHLLPGAAVDVGRFGPPILRVDRGRLTAEVHYFQQEQEGRLDRTGLVYILSGLPRGIELSRQGPGRDLLQLVTGSDHLTGDDGFDRGVTVGGDPALLTAALDGPTRQAVWALMSAPDGAYIRGGTLYMHVEGSIGPPGDIAARVEHLFDVCRRLCVLPSEIPARIAAVATRDRDPQVRRRATAILAERFQGAVVERAMRAQLASADPALRALAATRLGDADGLLAVILDGGAPAQARAEALHRLARGELAHRVAPELEALLRDPSPPVRQAAMRVAGRVDPPRALSLLRRQHPDDVLDRVALTDGLARVVGGEGWLLALLDDAAPEVRLAAVRALGRVGTVAAVPGLRARARERLGIGEIPEAARTALDQIQLRVGPVEAGQLSLVAIEDHSGAVSLAGASGQLGLADPDAEHGEGAPPRRPS